VRTLLLLRHAKSSWDDPALDDHARPLTTRGIEAARRIARYLADQHLRVDLVLCSSARRATQTLEELQPATEATAEVQITDELYGASSRAILQRLRPIDPTLSSVLVIGHNPGLEDLTSDLAGDGEVAAMNQLRAKFPTAALAVLDLGSTKWTDLGPGAAHLTALVVPRGL